MIENIRLYYASGACSIASHIALEESGLDFEAVRISFGIGEQRTDAYLAINPKGRVPVLIDGDFILTENAAILRYIAVSAPAARLWPCEIRDDARCAEWLAWCGSGVHASYSHVSRPERYANSVAGRLDVAERGRESTRALWLQMEKALAERKTSWAVGSAYSVADPYIFTFWLWGQNQVLLYDMKADFPAWTDHANRILSRPATHRALDREGLSINSR